MYRIFESKIPHPYKIAKRDWVNDTVIRGVASSGKTGRSGGGGTKEEVNKLAREAGQVGCIERYLENGQRRFKYSFDNFWVLDPSLNETEASLGVRNSNVCFHSIVATSSSSTALESEMSRHDEPS